MFQRLKGAIDSRIAEEQARQRASQNPPSRSSSTVRRSSGLADSPSRRASRARERKDNGAPPGKGPDPTDFEPEFVVGDDESLTGDGESGRGTPAPMPKQNAEKEDGGQENPFADGAAEAETKVETPRPSTELPTEVRVKLRKLDKLELRYQELLKAYRVAHARVTLIEPFEASLRENTPLTSISDPGALLEYLNQITLKGDMVIDELKRVSTERDDYKKKLEEAEKSAKDAWDEVAGLKKQKEEQSETASLVNETPGRASMDISSASDGPLGVTQKNSLSPVASPKTRTPSLVSIFSPKLKSSKSPPPKEESEEFFSYDSEIPRLELELKEAREEVVDLTSQLTKVKGDLSVARESTEGMVQSLESATRELHILRDGRDKHEGEIFDLRQKHNGDLSALREKHEEEIGRLNRDLKTSVEAANINETLHRNEVDSIQDEIKKTRLTVSELEAQKVENEKAIKSANEEEHQVEKVYTLIGLVDNLKGQLKDAEAKIGSLQTEIDERKVAADIKLETKTDPKSEEQISSRVTNDVLKHEEEAVKAEPQTADAATSSKKKNKKKRKGKGAAASNTDPVKQSLELEEATPAIINAKNGGNFDTIMKLQHELESLRSQLQEKDAERMQKKSKDPDDLTEEIKMLQDDLVDIGQEHVKTKDQIKVLMAEKVAMEETVAGLEKQLSSNAAGSEKAYSDLAAEFEKLKTSATAMQTDLSVAQQLAASRFKDLTDLRDKLQKMQPEVKSLKSELEETKAWKEKFGTKSNELSRLEARHDDLQSEVKGLRNTIAERDSEVKMLQQKISQETSNRLKAEEALGVAESDFRCSEAKKKGAIESNEKTARDLSKAQEELNKLREQASQMAREICDLKKEIQLMAAQYSRAQSSMNSIQDQSSEMAMRKKEAEGRCESLEEQLEESQRMLNERTHEGELMGRLLADAKGRADLSIRELNQRLDSAIEERDRLEDEASANGKKRAKEVEDLKTTVRDAEKALKLVKEDKNELERVQKDWERRREKLEEQVERSTSEMSGIRQAMGELRDALDDRERQTRELEKETTELRKTAEDAQSRVEKMQKTNRSMAEEIRSIKKPNSTVPSSRSSIDSRVGSPAPRNTSAATAKDTLSSPAVDYVYLKNVLLQFLEQKDRNHQKQLIPVLGMLLHFDKKDELKWMSVITAR